MLDFQRFVGVLDRVGCRFTDAECKALFLKHSNGSNLLSYSALSSMFFDMGSGKKDNTNPIYEMARSSQGSVTTHGMTRKLH